MSQVKKERFEKKALNELKDHAISMGTGFLIFAVIVDLLLAAPGIAALGSVHQIDNIFAVTGRPSLCLNPGLGNNSETAGWINVKIDLSGGSFGYQLFYNYNITAEGPVSRVLLRGPLVNTLTSPIQLSPPGGPSPIALTLCGGITSCSALETATCLSRSQPEQCQWIIREVSKLDSVTPDEPLLPSSLHQMHDLIKDYQSNPYNYYYTLETESSGEFICSTDGGSLASLK